VARDLANGENGVLNWALAHVGLGPVKLLYTEWAIIIGSVHVFLPMMVLPLSAALGKINPAVEEAARDARRILLRGVPPRDVSAQHSGPRRRCDTGVLAHRVVIRDACAARGQFAKMLGTLVEEQILVVFDWPFGATIATLLTLIVHEREPRLDVADRAALPSRASEAL